MKPRFHAVLVVSLAGVFLAGCSIRTIPLEEEQMVHEDGYYRGYDSLPPGFLYDTWQLSQYWQYYGDASGLGYLNIDPNPHDSYRTDEKPLQRAPAQASIQGTTPNRRVNERQERTVNRSRHTDSNRLAGKSIDNRSRLRRQLEQRHRQRTTNTVDDDDRKAQRRTTRRRAKR